MKERERTLHINIYILYDTFFIFFHFETNNKELILIIRETCHTFLIYLDIHENVAFMKQSF